MNQQNLSLAYLGPQGSFSSICAKKIQNELGNINLISAQTIFEIKQLLIDDKADYGLFPVENSLGGSVSETLDVLLKIDSDSLVKLEWVIPIEHCLIGYGKQSEIKEVRAHYQAFAQCENFLTDNFQQVQKKEFTSNSAAVESLISLNQDKKNMIAAISSKEASEIYGVPVIKNKINDFENNYTRFWLISKKELPKEVSSKQKIISLAFQLPWDEPGGLINVLSPLRERGANLTKIVSRPTKGRLSEYTFFIDFVNQFKSVNSENELIKELSSTTSFMRFIGSYPVLPENDSRFVEK